MRKRIVVLVLVYGPLFGAGFVANGLLASSPPHLFRQNDAEKHPLVAKEVFIKNPNDQIINFAPLRQSLNQYFTENSLSGSLYFEYLPTGTSIRVGTENREVAASLLKLPAAMDLYRAVEKGKVDLDQTITLKAEWLDDGYGELYKKGAGYRLSLRDAVRIMLNDSDNTALKAVASTTPSMNDQERSFNALDVDLQQNPDLTVSVTARSYNSFLKCLYFACYLSPEHSQEILQYLTETDFTNRLVAGITNKDIKVAHKIGVASQTTQSDCGIIYMPNRHYSLCVMLHGQDGATTDKHIAELSKRTYEYLINK